MIDVETQTTRMSKKPTEDTVSRRFDRRPRCGNKLAVWWTEAARLQAIIARSEQGGYSCGNLGAEEAMTGDFDAEGAVEWLGTKYKTLLTPEASDGHISVTDSVSPAQSGPPRHIHHDADESFVILTGEIGFWLDGKTQVCGPGTSFFIPRGTPHTFLVLGDAPSRHLVIMTPGGFEGFFVEMAAGQFVIPEDMPQIDESASRFKLAFVGPPLAPSDFGQ